MATSKGKKPNPRQEIFIREYLKDFNGTRAAIAAGYSKKTARAQASELLTKPDIQDGIRKQQEKRCQRLGSDADRIKAELRKLAYSDIRQVASWTDDQVDFIPSSEIPDEMAAAISEVSSTSGQYGRNLKLKLHSKEKALEMLARTEGMFKDNLDLTANIQPIIIHNTADGSRMELHVKPKEGESDGQGTEEKASPAA